MKKSVVDILRSKQVLNEKLSLLYLVITALTGYTSVVFSVLCFNTYSLLTVLLIPLSFIAICRAFIIIHDTGHFAFFKSRVNNSIAGNLLGLLIMIPNEYRSYVHNLHHSATGHLDKRHINPELWTMTTEEYLGSSTIKQLFYRIIRSGFMRLILIPFLLILVTKIPLPKLPWKAKISVIIYDIIYTIIIYYAIHYNLWLGMLIGYIIPLLLFNFFASVVFYLQHQFENTQWLSQESWNFYDAALGGSSFLKLNPVLNWIIGITGHHHIHHLNSKTPFYELKNAHEIVEDNIEVKEIYLSELFQHLRGKVWDKNKQRLIHYSELYER